MKTNRNHFLVVIFNSISDLIKKFWFLIILVFAEENEDKSILFKVLIIFGFFVIIVLFETLIWYKNTYDIRENIITVNKGVFVEKKKEIPFNKIQTINICEDLKHRIFGLALLKVDTGNSSSKESEISFVLKKDEAEEFKHNILKLKNEDFEEGNKEQLNLEEDKSNGKERKASNKELLLLSVTSSSILAGVFFIFAVYNFVDDYLKNLFGDFTKGIEDSVKTIDVKGLPTAKIIYMIILILIVYLAFSLIVSIISNFIKFYEFSIKRQEKNLIINYGMLNKKNYVMPVEKITALYIRQNIIKQVFGLQELHIESIGYGNESGETSMLYPICNELKKQELIKELLPEFYFDESIVKSPKRALRRFIISNLIWPSIICVILTLKFKYGYFSIFFLLIFILRGYLEYKNSGIGRNSKLICLINRGFHKTATIMTRKKIQSVIIRSNYFQRKNQIFDFKVDIQGNYFGKQIQVKNVGLELKSELEIEL